MCRSNISKQQKKNKRKNTRLKFRRRRKLHCYKINLFKRQKSKNNIDKTTHPEIQCTFNWVWIACNSVRDIIHWHWDLLGRWVRCKFKWFRTSWRKRKNCSRIAFQFIMINLELTLKIEKKEKFPPQFPHQTERNSTFQQISYFQIPNGILLGSKIYGCHPSEKFAETRSRLDLVRQLKTNFHHPRSAIAIYQSPQIDTTAK